MFFIGPTEFKDEYEAVFTKPVLKDEIKPPLIVFPHGGPHTAFTSDFFLYSACLCKLGFSILNGKYDGSTLLLDVFLRVQSGIISTISPGLALSLSRNTTGERVQGSGTIVCVYRPPPPTRVE